MPFFPAAKNVRALLGLACLLAILGASFAGAAPVKSGRTLLLISLDGLRPDYVTEADKHGLKIPNLRRLLQTGAYATGVRGVLPTSTYPSHTTILTGVSPQKHGIVMNHPFDAFDADPHDWFWFSENIRVPTLWQAAAGGGLPVGSISWPVSVGAEGITYNLPEYNGTRTPEDAKMVRALASRPLMAELEKSAGPYLMDVEDAVPRDWSRTRYAVALLREKHVRFLTVHLAASDHLQHEHGPFTPEVHAALEEIDRMIGTMADALHAEDPQGILAIVSDHGFSPVSEFLKVRLALAEAGLITLKNTDGSGEPAVKDWQATVWSAGGSAAIVLKNSGDEKVRAQVKAVLTRLAAEPTNGIAALLEPPAIAALGGTTNAAFWVDMQPGFSVSSSLKGPLRTSAKPRGTHGYVPTHAEVNASFFITGPGLPAATNLGVIDMRRLAPTFARILAVPFPTAELPPLEIFDSEAKPK